MRNTHFPEIGVRRFSRPPSWGRAFSSLVVWASLAWGLLGSRAFREESFQFDSQWRLQVLVFGGFCFFAWRKHFRLRSYVWKEAFEEGNEWVFRRKGQELRISCGEVEQVAPTIAGTDGLLALRLRRGNAREPLIVFAPAAGLQDGLSVPEYMEQNAAQARQMQQESPLETIPWSICRERISSNWTFAIKYLLPWMSSAGLAIWMVLSWKSMAESGEWSALNVGTPLLVAVLCLILYQEYLSNLADEIFHEEDALSIRHLGRVHRVPFSEVEHLEYRPLKGFHWIVLHLKTPHPLGRKIAFIPDGRGALYGWNPRLDALAERIGRA